jgi:predicted DNA-binding transcriptional regulator AlpA
MTNQHDLITADEYAAMARVTIRAVRKWAATGIGPRPLRPQGSRIVRYRRREIEAWLAGEPVSTKAAAS